MLFDFFFIVSQLKKVPRKGWKQKVGIEHPESVADHSYGTAIMAMVFSDTIGLNTEKILRMALLHDLAESITGDFMPEEISKENKKTTENDAMEEILSKLPSKLEYEYTQVWNEYMQQNSKEASLLHEIDRLEMAVQAMKYSSEGFSKEKLKIFVESARRDMKSKELLDMLDAIYYK